jgi:hypothetical protein
VLRSARGSGWLGPMGPMSMHHRLRPQIHRCNHSTERRESQRLNGSDRKKVEVCVSGCSEDASFERATSGSYDFQRHSRLHVGCYIPCKFEIPLRYPLTDLEMKIYLAIVDSSKRQVTLLGVSYQSNQGPCAYTPSATFSTASSILTHTEPLSLPAKSVSSPTY